jgi:hypothetical protein
MAEETRAMIVIEMMGRPVEHLKQVMKDFLKKMDKEEKGIKILKKKINKPKIAESKDDKGEVIKFPEGKEMYVTFAEIEIEAETIMDLIRIVFVYMPSHVEIIKPSDVRMTNFDFAGVLTEITRKLHRYDAIAKNSILQNKMLVNKIAQLEEMIRGAGNNSDNKEKNKGKGKKKK